MPSINELEMNKGQKLNDKQIERINVTIQFLAKQTNNAQAITLAHNLKMSKDIEEKRKWIVLYYVSCFQLLSFINMARDKDLPPAEYQEQLELLFKIGAHNGKS